MIAAPLAAVLLLAAAPVRAAVGMRAFQRVLSRSAELRMAPGLSAAADWSEGDPEQGRAFALLDAHLPDALESLEEAEAARAVAAAYAAARADLRARVEAAARGGDLAALRDLRGRGAAARLYPDDWALLDAVAVAVESGGRAREMVVLLGLARSGEAVEAREASPARGGLRLSRSTPRPARASRDRNALLAGMARVLRLELGANTNFFEAPADKDVRFPLRYYRLPASWARVAAEGGLPEELRRLVMTEDGHVRWFVHPADRRHHEIVRNALKRAGLDARLHVLKDRSARRTSSRSSFLEGLPYSLRMSVTDGWGQWTGTSERGDGGGFFYDKGTYDRDNEYARAVSARARNAPDSLAWLLPDVAQVDFVPPGGESRGGAYKLSYSFRDLGRFGDESRRYVPSFATYHPEAGALLTAVQGGSNASAAMPRLDGAARGAGSADLLLRDRLVMVSAHSQNDVLETDRFYRGTGRVHFRDAGDSISPPGLHSAYEPADLAAMKERFPDSMALHPALSAAGPMEVPVGYSWTHGGGGYSPSSHVDGDRSRDEFQAAFEAAFFARAAELSGVPEADLRAASRSYRSFNNGYDYVILDGEAPAWRAAFAASREGRLRGRGPVEPSVSPALSEAAAHLDASRVHELALLAERHPDEVLKALLAARLDGRDVTGFREALAPVERAFRAPGAERDRLALGLVLAGSHDPAVLRHLAESPWANPFARRLAIERRVLAWAARERLGRVPLGFLWGSPDAERVRALVERGDVDAARSAVGGMMTRSALLGLLTARMEGRDLRPFADSVRKALDGAGTFEGEKALAALLRRAGAYPLPR